MRIRVAHTESGCWAVYRDTYAMSIYPPHMWHHAYREALQEAIYQNLSITGIETSA
jgi:hypothetical protein